MPAKGRKSEIERAGAKERQTALEAAASISISIMQILFY